MGKTKYFYHKYLQSDEWSKKREKRMLLDNRKCKICGRPFDLQVHHLTYQNVPFEKMSDLITVCKNCHQKIEAQKIRPYYSSFNIVQDMMIKQFCIDFKERDYSAKGDLNLTNLEIIKANLYPYLCQKGFVVDNITGVSIIQRYFSLRRYEVILRCRAEGWPDHIIKREFRFSDSMINKATNEMITLLKLEKEKNNE